MPKKISALNVVYQLSLKKGSGTLKYSAFLAGVLSKYRNSVVLAAAIGTAIWQSSVATKIANEYRKILFDTNQIFCGNPNSDLCNKWNAYKETRKYSQNLKMADSLGETLKKGVKVVAGGLATGLLVAVALVFFLRSR